MKDILDLNFLLLGRSLFISSNIYLLLPTIFILPVRVHGPEGKSNTRGEGGVRERDGDRDRDKSAHSQVPPFTDKFLKIVAWRS